MKLLGQIKQSRWNRSIISNPTLDQLFNWLFWVILIGGLVVAATFFWSF